MTYRIKKIMNAGKPRAYITLEELDAQENPTGRTWTEPFDTEKKDWAQLKQRFKERRQKDDMAAAAETQLIEEANNAGITAIS